MEKKQPQRNKFEMLAHQVQFQHPFKKKQRPAFSNNYPDGVRE